MTEPTTRNSTGVFIVDDHPSFLSVAKAVVDAANGFELCGWADTADDALKSITAAAPPPDLVLLDVNLGEQSGVDVATVLSRIRSGVKIIFVSALACEELPANATESGADGYLPKLQLSPATLEATWAGAYDWRP